MQMFSLMLARQGYRGCVSLVLLPASLQISCLCRREPDKGQKFRDFFAARLSTYRIE